MDYGSTILRMVAKHYGKSYSLQYFINNSFITREGVSMLGISEAAEQIGFRTKGYNLTCEQLHDEALFSRKYKELLVKRLKESITLNLM